MAEQNRASMIAKNIQKHAGRAKELFRQNLGKADKTTDEGFEEYVRNFTKQQGAAARLQKEVKNYHNSIKMMKSASKTLMEVIGDLYEPNWVQHDKIQVQAEVLENKFDDYHDKLNEQVIEPLVTYSEQFPDVNNKILKRKRKLLDYDNCRHTIQSLENNPKKKEDGKLLKAKEQLNEKQNLYDAINEELLKELPALYDSRVSFLASNLQCLFLAEANFHHETSKIFTDLSEAVEALATENQKGVYSAKKSREQYGIQDISNNESFKSAEGRPDDIADGSSSEYLSAETLPNISDLSTTLNESVILKDASTAKKVSPVAETVTSNDSVFNAPEGCEKSNPPDSQLPAGVLYKVKAAFAYVAEDADELSFEPGETIYVTEFEDPDLQEEGWLMGYKEGSSIKGLFPSNFTKPL